MTPGETRQRRRLLKRMKRALAGVRGVSIEDFSGEAGSMVVACETAPGAPPDRFLIVIGHRLTL
jgi:hypothetical protein